MKLILFFSSLLLFIGCTQLPVNEVRKPLGQQQAIAQIESSDIKPGDQVQVIKRECRMVERRNLLTNKCTENIVGKASIVEMKSEREAVIKAEPDIALESGMILKKIN